jgi:DNA-binding transcriptional MerR regulator/DNA-directed RNA polymerase subunit RPC12/RpoP
MSKYSTGELAKLCNVSVRTVQFYDAKGLLPPTELTDGGRRIYTDDDLAKLRLICMLKALGLALDSIQGILSNDAQGKVLTLLLDEQIKQLDSDIKEKREQIDAIKIVKDNIRSMDAIPVNSINDIEHMMKNKKGLRKVHGNMIAIVLAMCTTALVASIAYRQFATWIPFAIGLPLMILCIIWLVRYYYTRTAYICAECCKTFRPKLGAFMFSNHTPKTRKLTCIHCGKKGWCVETVADR